MYLRALTLVHVLSAIAGFGPTFAFPILSTLAKKSSPDGVKALTLGIHAIIKRMVIPSAFVVQPLTGILLIFELGYAKTLPYPVWLTIALILYGVLIAVAAAGQIPTENRMAAIVNAGTELTPEFGALAKRASVIGSAMGVLLLAIIFLMEFKPGF